MYCQHILLQRTKDLYYNQQTHKLQKDIKCISKPRRKLFSL